jgi:Lon protease-like protein
MRQKAKALDQLFYSTSSTLSSEDYDGAHPRGRNPAAEDPARAALLSLPGVIPDLRLWRVQWAVLPSYQEVLHVHVPHYVDLFSQLFTQKRPWRFGHLYLPNGSASLGAEEYALQYGSNAPLVGTLMEIVQAVRFPDGRLLILAAGVGRFKVLNTLQTVPASRADVMLLPDEEELQAASESSTKALEQLTKDEKLSVMRAMHAADAAAQHGAAAAAQSWWEYELMHCRVHEKLAVIDSSDNETAAMQFGRRLVNIGSNEIMELPWASDDLNKKYFSMMQTPPASYESDGEEDSETPLFDVNIKAEVAAIEAAEEMIQRLLKYQQQETKNSGGEVDSSFWQELETFLRNRYSAMNSLKERGINPIASSGAGGRLDPQSPSFNHEKIDEDDDKEEEIDNNKNNTDNNDKKEVHIMHKDEESTPSGSNFLVDCLKLEQQVWHEIDAVRELAEKIAGRSTPLADGLTCLRPPLSSSFTSFDSSRPFSTSSTATGVGDLEHFKKQEAEWKQRNQENHLEEMAGGKDLRGIYQGAHPGFPQLRRIQRLSFALASSLGDVSASEGRQAWLEVHSVAGRLRLGLSALKRHRDVLAAVVAVRNLSDSGGGGENNENLEN